MEPTIDVADTPVNAAADAAAIALTGDEALVAEELLVEEISIDGMCGVY